MYTLIEVNVCVHKQLRWRTKDQPVLKAIGTLVVGVGASQCIADAFLRMRSIARVRVSDVTISQIAQTFFTRPAGSEHFASVPVALHKN